MKFQDASCPSLAVSVLSSSVEPPSQSLAVSVSSTVDVTVMTRRSTWCLLHIIIMHRILLCIFNIFHVPTNQCPIFWRNGLKCIFRQLFYIFLLKLHLHYNELARRTATVWRYLTYGEIRCYTLEKSDECDH